MPKLKKVDYPELSADDAIEAVRVINDKFHGEVNNIDSYAAALGHKTSKSGAFLTKLADIRKWGLIERNNIRPTPFAQKILYPKNDKELSEARLEMLMHVPIFKTIYERLRGQLPGEDFWILIAEITGIERSEAQKEANKISKIYKDALNRLHIEKKTTGQPESGRGMIPESKEGMFEATFGDVFIRIPKSKEGVEELEALVPLIKKRISGRSAKDEGK